jgi:solute carrier family 25 citrate transporter 1
VRFTTYTTLKQFVQSTARPGQQLPTGITFGIGAIAGLVTVYVTQPLEYALCLFPPSTSDVWNSVIKTRMQSLNAPREYKNSFHCGYRILTEEGLLRFWTGTTPRLTRLVVSSRVGCRFMQRMTCRRR